MEQRSQKKDDRANAVYPNSAFVGTCPQGNGFRCYNQCLYPQSKMNKHTMYIRGDSFGLNWNSGKSMANPVDDVFTITLSGTKSGLTIKHGKLLRPKKKTKTGAKSLKKGEGNILKKKKKGCKKKDKKIKGANSMYSFDSNSPSSVNLTTYPWFYTYSGDYEYTRNVYSPQLNNYRDLVVYLPPSFYENTLKQYTNVLVMHDGQNLFNASTSFAGVAWDVQDTINQQVVEGNMEEVIVIGDGGGADYYLDFIEQTAIPTIRDDRYPGRIPTSLKTFGMIGSSLGGLVSCYCGWTRADTFNKLGCMSSSFWWNNFGFNTTILYQTYSIRPNYIYLDVGALEPYQQQIVGAIAVRDHLVALGYVLNQTLKYYFDPTGQHNEASWGARFWIPMQFLYPPIAYPLKCFNNIKKSQLQLFYFFFYILYSISI
ncbi:putative esterase [Reticulomyxa filosa]|uniref:Putative esterase n=1 Tax=Reticulomyxa filosa TaxID=46433 RepID=X6NRR0_RETFI|nr:putative esterase [Reticulomyxa filosa]|eukprot:ETO28379.1 putative esterase [Reticulomyxa filosa]